MSFIDVQFAYFLPIVLGLWIVARHRYWVALPLLLAASLVFYGSRQWWVVPIILGYCIVDWLTGLWLERTDRPRLALTVGVAFNVAVLCFWKY